MLLIQPTILLLTKTVNMKTKLLAYIMTFILVNFFLGLQLNAQNKIKSKPALSIASAHDYSGNSSVVNSVLSKVENSTKSACDTLNLNAYKNTWTVVDYSVSATPLYSSGFINGVNTYGDKAKAAYFANTNANTYITGGMFALSRAYSSNPSKTVTVRIWNVVSGNPGSILASQTVTMQQLMTDANGNYFSVVQFANPVLVSGAAFFMGFDISGLDWATSHDTLSIQSNQDPQTTPTTTWEMQSDNLWYSYTNAASWNLNISLAVFPVMTNVPADASFTQSATNTCVGYPVTFNAAASVQNTVYWVLAGATPSTSSTLAPVVHYANAGTYPVKLYVHGGSCNNLDSMITTIVIAASPVPNATATPSSVCPGSSTVLSAANGISYQWNGQPLGPTPNITVTPTTNTTYTVTVTNSNGCSASQSVNVTLYTPPAPVATATPSIFCNGSSVLLSTAPGMSSYVWAPGGNTTAAFVANPTTNTTYTVSVTDAHGCTATDDITVTEFTEPEIGSDTTICVNASLVLDAGAGYDSYIWSDGEITQTISFSGTSIGTFPVYVTVTSGTCSATDSLSVTFILCNVGEIETNNNVNISMVPNPTTGVINVSVNGFNAPAQLAIYSLLGQLMYADKIDVNATTSLNLSQLAKGVYMVRIFNDNTSTLNKLVIQ